MLDNQLAGQHIMTGEETLQRVKGYIFLGQTVSSVNSSRKKKNHEGNRNGMQRL